MLISRLLIAICLLCSSLSVQAAESVEWPEITQTAMPWTRWWWHGSAVDKENLTRCLEQYAAAGLGGVEITCIYGVKGTKDRQLRYLSPEWLEAVTHATNEAHRLGMGVDMPPGSGWRMGGPRVPIEDSNAVFVLAKPQASWTIDSRMLGEKVKRPAPGGEGFTINPFSRQSVTAYLADFAKRTESLPKDAIRASFHDSFEYDGNWSESFLKKFAEIRGYRLEDHLPALAGESDRYLVARVKSDYRETMSDLVLGELIVPWVEWSHAHGQLARNQAHGSPGNWLDLYAACDIPETESFGQLHKNDANPLIQKFASSAAHVAGRKLVSSESATWLDQHFTETLAVVKERLDRQMLAGINHVFYHGTAYSPDDAEWPGWLFYASTQFNPQNPIWRDFPTLNQYAARCQAMLQTGEPSNDLLIYWPIHDVWHDSRGLRKDLRVHDSTKWFDPEPIGKAAKELDKLGVSFDYISDRQVMQCEATDKQIKTAGPTYRAILVPAAEYMPPATLAKLAELAHGGANVLFWKELPQSAPGLLTEAKSLAFPTALAAAKESAIVDDDLATLLKSAEISAEPFVANTPLRSIRRKLDDGWCYFLKNTSNKDFDGAIGVNVAWKTAVLMDPLTGGVGTAAVQGEKQVRVQLPAGGTIFLRTFDEPVAAEPWQYQELIGEPFLLKGEWNVDFLEGGPEILPSVTTSELGSWTKLPNNAGQKFVGTAAYNVPLPSSRPGKYLLDLGVVADSARVFVNGEELGVLFTPPFEIPINLVPGENYMTVEVTNVAANRIRDLDRRKVKWQIFEDINFVGINFEDNKYLPFDASNWPLRDAGLLGPVTLQKLSGE